LARCDEDTWVEWVDGAGILLSPAAERHQNPAAFPTRMLHLFAEVRGLGIVLSAPFQMKLWPSGPGGAPNLLFVARERRDGAQEYRDRVCPTFLGGPADLGVESTVPERVSRDRGEKAVVGAAAAGAGRAR
jgi:hypothetical protein